MGCKYKGADDVDVGVNKSCVGVERRGDAKYEVPR